LQSGCALAISAFGGGVIAPKAALKRKSKRNQTTPEDGESTTFTKEDLAEIVSHQIVEAIPNIISQLQANMNLNNNHDRNGVDSGDGDDANVGSSRKGCSYKNFVS
jgi:hypothetical protein